MSLWPEGPAKGKAFPASHSGWVLSVISAGACRHCSLYWQAHPADSPVLDFQTQLHRLPWYTALAHSKQLINEGGCRGASSRQEERSSF